MTINRKGIVLAGGSGTRLYPVTIGTSKQLLPIYDKPMIYYPLSVLMLANIREILLISTPEDIKRYEMVFGDGSQFGINISYKIQPNPGGLAEAFLLGEDFIGSHDIALVLGDNIFHGPGFEAILNRANSRKKGATIFSSYVQDPERFGVVEFNDSGRAISIEEKPEKPKSNYAVTGLYFYDNQVIDIAKSIDRSERGELEISCVNKIYLENNNLNVEALGRGFAWLDSGTHDSLIDASQYIKTIEKRQGFKVACLEEIAFNKRWINKEVLLNQIQLFDKTKYGEYLKKIISVDI